MSLLADDRQKRKYECFIDSSNNIQALTMIRLIGRLPVLCGVSTPKQGFGIFDPET
jgi:hypothetical protein